MLLVGLEKVAGQILCTFSRFKRCGLLLAVRDKPQGLYAIIIHIVATPLAFV